jgi:hypothetical protein
VTARTGSIITVSVREESRPAQNIVLLHLPGPKTAAKNADTCFDFYSSFIAKNCGHYEVYITKTEKNECGRYAKHKNEP